MVQLPDGTEQSVDQSIQDRNNSSERERNDLCANTTDSHEKQELELHNSVQHEDQVDRTEYESCLDEGNALNNQSVELFNNRLSNGTRVRTRSKSLELFYNENFANLENGCEVDDSIQDGVITGNVSGESDSSRNDFEVENSSCGYNRKFKERSSDNNNNRSSNSNSNNGIDNEPDGLVDNNNSNNFNKDIGNNSYSQNKNKGLWEITKALNAYEQYMSQSSLDELSCIEEEGSLEEVTSEMSENGGDVICGEGLNQNVLEMNELRENGPENGAIGYQEGLNVQRSNEKHSGEVYDDDSDIEQVNDEEPFPDQKPFQNRLNDHRLDEQFYQQKLSEDFSDGKLIENGFKGKEVLKRKPTRERLQSEIVEGQRYENGVEGSELEEEEGSDVETSEWESDVGDVGERVEENGQGGGGSYGRRKRVSFNDSKEYNGDDSDVGEMDDEDEHRSKNLTKRRQDDERKRDMAFVDSKTNDDYDDDEDSFEDESEYSSEEEMSDSSVEQGKVAIKNFE